MPTLFWRSVSSFFSQLWRNKTLFIGPILAVLGLQLGWFGALDRLYYDYLIKKQTLPPADNFVVVTIDDASLMQLGAWPWPRAIHAELIHQLDLAKPKAIAFDVLFSEPTQALDDHLLAEAIEKSGRVYLPVYISTLAYQQQLVERLPLPQLSNVAKGLGHIHYVIDEDGISRSVFLREGLNEAFWPHLSLSIKQGVDSAYKATGMRASEGNDDLSIKRDYLNLLPFLSAEAIPSVSYIEVLAGQVPQSVFEDKVVFIGATAPGLGDFVITPTSSQERRFPGVMFNASVFHALDNDLFIQPVALKYVLFVALLISITSLLLGIWLAGIPLLLNCVIAASGLLLLSAYLLLEQRFWLPPFAGVVGGLMAYPAWSLIKTEQALHFLRQELERLEISTPKLASYSRYDLELVLNALAQQGVISTWQLGNAALIAREQLFSSSSNSHLIRLAIDDKPCSLLWQSELDEALVKPYLDNIIEPFNCQQITPHYSWEVIAATIAKIKEANKAAQNFYNFAQQNLAKLHAPLIISERSGRIIFINDCAKALFSQSYIFVQDLFDCDVKFLDIAADDFFRELFMQAKSQERELKTYNGQRFILSADIDSFDQVGDVSVFILANITRLRELEQSRSEALHLLSHDLRSPLVSALSVMEKSASKDLHWCNNVRQHVQRSLRYAEDFLNLARAESLEKTAFYECDFYAVVDQAIAQLMPQIKAKNQQFDFTYEDYDFWVLGNADLLERMVVNLMSNATKYSEENTLIRLNLAVDNEYLLLTLSDQGFGMDKDTVEKLFQSFYRANHDQAQKVSGIGLGMRLVSTVIERHQGSIRVDSDLGQGTDFYIRLPMLELA